MEQLFGEEEERIARFIANIAGGSLERSRSHRHVERLVEDRSRQLFAALAMSGSTRRQLPTVGVGDLIQERYRVQRVLGEGGMGVVYEARRVSDQRRVALKVPKGLQGKALARTAREAMVLAQVDHPNVVHVLDVDITDQGLLYFAMEYIEGTSLPPKPAEKTLEWRLSVLRQVAEGLDALHQQGIIHRDLKPANVMLTDRTETSVPWARITDFGISRAGLTTTNAGADAAARLAKWQQREPASNETHDRLQPPPSFEPDATATCLVPRVSPSGTEDSKAKPALTEDDEVIGTPPFIAPECALGSTSVTEKSDLFSLGVMAHLILSGRFPFPEPPVLAVLTDRPVPIPHSFASVEPELPSTLAETLDDCLSLTPEKRPSARAVADMIARALPQLRE